MEDEIKVNEYARDDFGNLFVVIGKYERGQFGEICVQLGDFKTKEFAGEQWERNIKIGNLIDLIQCGDYVNGYKVVETYKDKQLNGWQVGKTKEDETWLGVVVSSKMIKEPLQEYFDNEIIKTIVTKEQFESISYKVTKM